MKFSFIFILLLFNSTLIKGQKLTLLGLRIGYVKNQILGDNYKGLAGEGFHGGLFSQLRVSKKSNFEMELLYSIKGCSSSGGTITRNLVSKYKATYYDLLYYFEVPVLYQYHHKFLCLEAGPGFGYLLREFTYEQKPSSINYFAVPARKIDLSMNIGLGYQSDKRFGCGIRFNSSFVPIRKVPTAQYNFNILFILFYRIIAQSNDK